MTHTHTVNLPHEGIAAAVEEARAASGDLTDQLIGTDVWTDEMVAAAGIPVVDCPMVSVGGGIGSFILADHLRVAGMAPEKFVALGALDVPWGTYEYLTRVSQIPRPERLRSDSGSTPDNVWGVPSYAYREFRAEKGFQRKFAPLWNVFTEPIFTDYFTPRAGQVFESMEVEAQRIGYLEHTAKGLVRMIRRRHGGGYFTILTPPAGSTPTKRVAYRSTYVHVAVGYPGLRFLPDLQAYRTTYEDFHRVLNAYEPHEHVYEELRQRPGTVVVRGNGIVASRVLQRLVDERDQHGSQIQIVHLVRNYIGSSHGPSIFMRRKGANGWAHQGFNVPKSSWGGQLKARLERTEGEDRRALYALLGGTTTPHRKLWLNQLARGRTEGWYRLMVGTVDRVVPGDDTVVSTVKTDQGPVQLPANYIIDSTGLEADISEHRVLADLLDHSGAGRNPLGRLDVGPNYEIRGTRSGVGKMYASGSATAGGYFSGVDSFLGLGYVALRIADDLAAEGFVPRITVGRSWREWRRWLKRQPPEVIR
jgi:hypothetical protein